MEHTEALPFIGLINPILYDEAGTPHPYPTDFSSRLGPAQHLTGSAELGYRLGEGDPDFPVVGFGRPDIIGYPWVADFQVPPSIPLSFYSISGELTVVPEPSAGAGRAGFSA